MHGIGPREQRPVRLDLAWHTAESNQVGIHEFADWCAAVGTEMMLAVADVVKIACIAQFVNVIAPIMTEPGGSAWRQTIYYPYYFASHFGRGTALDLKVAVPGYASERHGEVPYADVAGVANDDGTLSFFAVNRHAGEAVELEVTLTGFGALHVLDHQVMTHADLEATNTAAAPDSVVPARGSGARVSGDKLKVTLPPYSYQMLRLGA